MVIIIIIIIIVDHLYGFGGRVQHNWIVLHS